MQNHYPYPIQPLSPNALAQPGQFAPVDFLLEERDLFGRYWGVVRRHLWMILCLFVIAEVLTVLFLAGAPRLYTSSSTISIEPQTPEALPRETTRDDSGGDLSFYTTEWEVLKSRTLAARVIRDLRLGDDPAFIGEPEKPSFAALALARLKAMFPGKPAALSKPASRDDILGVDSGLIDEYLAGLTIRPEFETRMVIVAYTSTDPVLAARLTNAHVQAYIRQGYELRTRGNETTQRFLEGQLGQLEKRIERSEAALNDYRRERGIVAFTLDDKDRLVSERIADINKELVEAQERRIALQAEVETIKNNDDDTVPEVVNNSLIQGLRVELSRLHGQYANLSAEYTPNYPDVARLQAQIRQVQRHEDREIARVIASLKDGYDTAVDREKQLGKQLESEKAHAMALNDASLRDAVLAREVDTNRALYRDVLERFKLLGVASESRLTNVSVVDPATVSQFPSSPKQKMSLILAGFLALMVGISLAFLLDMRDKGIKTADDLEQSLRLPALATVLRFSNTGRARLGAAGLLRLLQWTGSSDEHNGRYLRQVTDTGRFMDVATAKTGAKQAALRQKSFSATIEAYRTIRTRILLSRPDAPPKTILFTSAVSGEGKTAIAINTAVAFAGLQESVLLVDGDLRRGRCHQIMNRNGSPGLTEVLSGLIDVEDAIQPTSVKGLFMLASGASSPSPSELLGSRKMSEVLAYLESKYKYVFLDSAPVLPVSDSVLLSTIVDAVVVVAGRQTPRQVVRLGGARLASVGARMIGAVLNSVELEHEPYYAQYMQY